MIESYYQAVHAIITTGHLITDKVNTKLKEVASTEPQFNVLMILHMQKRAMSIQEIQEQMVQRSSNVSRLVDKLLAKGYVSRKENHENRRKVDIVLTATGSKHLQELNRYVAEVHEPQFNNLSERELSNLVKLIQKLKGDTL
ncbi:MAG: MarR family transcriptional regulator [Spirochaetota bacterium]